MALEFYFFNNLPRQVYFRNSQFSCNLHKMSLHLEESKTVTYLHNKYLKLYG